jgi:hypothetical protein
LEGSPWHDGNRDPCDAALRVADETGDRTRGLGCFCGGFSNPMHRARRDAAGEGVEFEPVPPPASSARELDSACPVLVTPP